MQARAPSSRLPVSARPALPGAALGEASLEGADPAGGGAPQLAVTEAEPAAPATPARHRRPALLQGRAVPPAGGHEPDAVLGLREPQPPEERRVEAPGPRAGPAGVSARCMQAHD